MELIFHVAGLDEIKQWVMSLGHEAEVLEPEDCLRKAGLVYDHEKSSETMTRVY
jgi:hypothetical protein